MLAASARGVVGVRVVARARVVAPAVARVRVVARRVVACAFTVGQKYVWFSGNTYTHHTH